MFCPKCGTQNPETGRFCRSCGSDLGNVSQALSTPVGMHLVDRKGKPISWERAIVKIFTGLAFIVVATALALTGNGRGWWFWLLIPAFTSLGAGIAQYVQLKKADGRSLGFSPNPTLPAAAPQSNLPPARTEWVSPESRYKTGDLVPPSVTDATTRHLEMDPEGKTMTLPKQQP